MKIVDKSEKEIEAPYELPEGWKWCRLGDTCEMYQPQTISTKDLIENGDYLVYGANGVIGRYNEYNHEKSQLLVTCRGATCGSVNISEPFSWINGNAMVISPFNSSILLKYMYYIFQSVVNFNKVITGSAQPQITRQSLIPVTFPLPPTLEEQQRIVSRIETLFAKLDQAKEKAQNVVDTFETRKASILHKAFTGELTKKWREENGVGDDTWEEKILEDVCDFITKGTTPKKEDMTIGQGDIPYIKVYNLRFDTTLDFSINPTFVTRQSHENFLARSKTFPGDVLMNIVGPPFGKVSIVPNIYAEWNLNQAIARFRCKKELLNTYLANYLISPKTIESMSNQIKTTAGQQNLTLEICRNIKISVPTLPEQTEIVRILDTILEKETKAKEAAEAVLEQIDLLKKSILARAFRGEL